MNKISHLFFSTILFFSQPLKTQELNILPAPQQTIRFEAGFDIQPGVRLLLPRDAEALDRFTLNYLREEIANKTGVHLSTTQPDSLMKWNRVIYVGRYPDHGLPRSMAQDLNLAKITEIGTQGYYLQATDSAVVVLAETAQGRFYGCLTLLQLMRKQDQRFQVPGVTIYDWPVLSFRGIFDDFESLPLPTTNYFKQIVQQMSRAKLNVYVLGLNNRFAFQGHPKIAQGRATLTSEAVDELQTVADSFHVQIIPSLEILKLGQPLKLPEYARFAEFPGSTILAPLKPETYDLLNDLILEAAQAFRSPYLYLTGNGSDAVGWHASRPEVQRYGLNVVLAEHLRRVVEIAQKYDKRVILDVQFLAEHPEIVNLLPDDVILIQTGQTQPASKLLLSGKSFWVSRGLWSGESIFPQYNKSFPAIQKDFKSAKKAGADGVILVNRNRGNGFSFHAYRDIGVFWAGEHAWSAQPNDWSRFSGIYFAQLFDTQFIEPDLIYGLLSDIANIVLWRDFQKHVLSEINHPANFTAERIHSIKTKVPQLLRLIDRLSVKEIQNKPHLDYLKFVAILGHWAKEKIETTMQLHEFIRDVQLGPTDGQALEFLDSCVKLLEQLSQVEDALQLLWIRCYRIEDLPAATSLFARQHDYWQEIIERLKTAHITTSPLLASQWVYHPNLKSAEDEKLGHAFFRKTFEVEPGFRRVYLQAFADTHIKIYVNGGFIDEVLIDPTDSVETWTRQARSWDITSIVQPGKNIIAVEAWNYEPGKPAGLNIVGQIEYEFGRTLSIESDSYWKVSRKEEQNWRKLGFFDVQWYNTVISKKNFDLTEPNFKLGQSSFIY